MRKLFLTAIFFGALGASAFAQDPTPPTSPPKPAQQREYTLKVTDEDLNLLAAGLQTQPYGRVAPLINKLQAQIIEQQRTASAAPPPPVAPTARPPAPGQAPTPTPPVTPPQQ